LTPLGLHFMFYKTYNALGSLDPWIRSMSRGVETLAPLLVDLTDLIEACLMASSNWTFGVGEHMRSKHFDGRSCLPAHVLTRHDPKLAGALPLADLWVLLARG